MEQLTNRHWHQDYARRFGHGNRIGNVNAGRDDYDLQSGLAARWTQFGGLPALQGGRVWRQNSGRG